MESPSEAALNHARAALRQAATRIEKAREPMDREKCARRGGALKELSGTRWTLVDKFESDGKRYVVVQQDAEHVDAANALSPREYAVLSAAAAGNHNKLIASDLGLACSTVRVLLFRAMRKLGAAGRNEAIAMFLK